MAQRGSMGNGALWMSIKQQVFEIDPAHARPRTR
jgi:hypothetical protein